MAKISISMSDKMEQFVAERVDSGDFNNTSEYFRDLVRGDQERRQAEGKLRTIVERSIKSGLSKRTPQEVWEAAEARHKMKRRAK